MEETTKMCGIDDPIREKMFVNDEMGGLKCSLFGLGPSNTMMKLFANAGPHPPHTPFPLPQAANPAREADGPSSGASTL